METLAIKTENKFRTLVTKRAYKKGEVICSMPSENIVDKPTRFTVQIARDRHTHVGKLAALNHSCDPNVILDTEKMLMIARRDIEKGEELFFFYPATEWEMQAPFICMCGSANCIQVVAGARFLSLSVLETQYLSKHIRESISELANKTELHLKKIQEAK